MKTLLNLLIALPLFALYTSCQTNEPENTPIDITKQVNSLNTNYTEFENTHKELNAKLDACLANKDSYAKTDNFYTELNGLSEKGSELQSELNELQELAGNNYTSQNPKIYETLKKDIANIETKLLQLEGKLKSIDANNMKLNENQATADAFLKDVNSLSSVLETLMGEYQKFEAEVEKGTFNFKEFSQFNQTFSDSLDVLSDYQKSMADVLALPSVKEETKSAINSAMSKIDGIGLASQSELKTLESSYVRNLLNQANTFNNTATEDISSWADFKKKIDAGDSVDETEFNKVYDFLLTANDVRSGINSDNKDLSVADSSLLTAFNKLNGFKFPSENELNHYKTENQGNAGFALEEILNKPVVELQGKNLRLNAVSQITLSGNSLNDFANKVKVMKVVLNNGLQSAKIDVKLSGGTVSLNVLNSTVDNLKDDNVSFVNNVNDRSNNITIDTNGKTDLTFEDLRFWDLENPETMLKYVDRFIFEDMTGVNFKDEVFIDLKDFNRNSFPLSNIYVNFGYSPMIKKYEQNRAYILPKDKSISDLYGKKLLFTPTYFRFDPLSVSFVDIEGNQNSVNLTRAASTEAQYDDDFVLENIVDFMNGKGIDKPGSAGKSIGQILMNDRQDVRVIPSGINTDNTGDFFAKFAPAENDYRIDDGAIAALARVQKGNGELISTFNSKPSDHKTMVKLRISEYIKLVETLGGVSISPNLANSIVVKEDLSGLRTGDNSPSGTVIYEGDMLAGKIYSYPEVWEAVDGTKLFTQRNSSVVALGKTSYVSVNGSSYPDIYYLPGNAPGDGYGNVYTGPGAELLPLNPQGNDMYLTIPVGGVDYKFHFIKDADGNWTVKDYPN